MSAPNLPWDWYSGGPVPNPTPKFRLPEDQAGPEPPIGPLPPQRVSFYPGQLERGNIDLAHRPQVRNLDGSISTVRSLGVNLGNGQETLIPTVSMDGKMMSDDAAVREFEKTGQHLGKFDTIDASNNAAQKIHEEQATKFRQPPPLGTILAPADERRYQQWKAKLPKRLQFEGDYDLRGFFKKNPTFRPDVPGAHMTDEFKLPNHPTFSNESMYYNDKTANMGGHWEGDVYVPNDTRYKQRVDETKEAAVLASRRQRKRRAVP